MLGIACPCALLAQERTIGSHYSRPWKGGHLCIFRNDDGRPGLSVAESGEEVFVDTFSGNGGLGLTTNIEATAGINGKWLAFSLSSESVPPGFFLLTILETESLSAKGCKEGSVNLQNGVISDPFVSPKTIVVTVLEL